MFSAISICTTPIISKHKLNSFIKPNTIFRPKLDFSIKFPDFVSWGCKESSTKKTKKTNMSGLVKSRFDDEKIEPFEQEAFIDESTTFKTSGLEATLNKLSKWIVAVTFGAIILWRHDAEVLWAAMGSILNAGLSTLLKRILNQERPFPTAKSDPGMPSSHAQSIFFIVTFIILSMVEQYQLNGATAILGVIIFSFGAYFSWLRVSQKLHTVSQVVVGALLGSVFSLLWYWSWNAIVLYAFESSLLIRIAVVLGSGVLCLAFLAYVIQNWVMYER